jgi:hypothetical protein
MGKEEGMGFESRRMQRLSKLFGEIEARKQSERKTPSYKDAPALREIAEITREQLSDSTDADMATIEDAVIIIRFLAESYDALGRYSISAYYYNKLFELARKAREVYNVEFDETAHDFYNAVRVRNAYVDDDCDDLASLVYTLLPTEKIKERISLIKAKRRNMRFDPIETTKEYLAVIDYVESKIASARKTYGPGSCLEYFLLKQKFLAEQGIPWRSPVEMNPTLNFSKYEC